MNIPADAAFGGCGRDARVPRADANLPIDDAGSIEVVRGPNSALYVRTAIGGAVNVRTGEPTAGNRVGPSWVVARRKRFDIIRSQRHHVESESVTMVQVTARLPDDLVEKADRAASQLNRSRAQLVRQALEYYLDDFEDLRLALDRLNDPADPVLDWEDVKGELLDQDQE